MGSLAWSSTVFTVQFQLQLPLEWQHDQQSTHWHNRRYSGAGRLLVVLLLTCIVRPFVREPLSRDLLSPECAVRVIELDGRQRLTYFYSFTSVSEVNDHSALQVPRTIYGARTKQRMKGIMLWSSDWPTDVSHRNWCPFGNNFITLNVETLNGLWHVYNRKFSLWWTAQCLNRPSSLLYRSNSIPFKQETLTSLVLTFLITFYDSRLSAAYSR